MIAYLKGELTYKSPTLVFVECNGVGYMVQISLQTFQKIEDLKQVKLFTYLHLYENGQALYGFFLPEEMELFILLISVTGVGPTAARLILSYLNIEEISNAIMSGNQALLQSIKGIGQKTAQRIIIDLKDKIGKDKKIESNGEIFLPSKSLINEEALAALTMLGFQRVAAEKVIQKVIMANKNIDSVEELIKLSLKNL